MFQVSRRWPGVLRVHNSFSRWWASLTHVTGRVTTSLARWLIENTWAFFQVEHISWDCLNYSSTRNNCPITRHTFTFQALCFPNYVSSFENSENSGFNHSESLTWLIFLHHQFPLCLLFACFLGAHKPAGNLPLWEMKEKDSCCTLPSISRLYWLLLLSLWWNSDEMILALTVTGSQSIRWSRCVALGEGNCMSTLAQMGQIRKRAKPAQSSQMPSELLS